jgi:S1-C subfamily serine protease
MHSWLDAVVALGVEPLRENGEPKFVATGFICGHPIMENENGVKVQTSFLVTNRHVFEDMNRVYVRFNPKEDEKDKGVILDLIEQNDSPVWVGHPNDDIDVAVILFPSKYLRPHTNAYCYDGLLHVANRKKMKEIGVTEGDFVYVLGYPDIGLKGGIVGDPPNAVIVRSGCISRVRDVIEGYASSFLVDAFVFPGNSGGPVVLRPDVVTIPDYPTSPNPYLVGMVRAYIPYLDVAVSEQTRRNRIVFEENSGLVEVIPMDYVLETIDEYLSKHPTTIEMVKDRESSKPPEK